MKVRIISITQPLIEGIHTAEDLIVHNARVSNPSNQLNTLTGPKLLAHCIKHGHWSVFAQADFTVEVKTSRAISAQIIRHYSISPQEFSQRYAEVAEIEPIEIRAQAASNRQSSTDLLENAELNAKVEQHVQNSLELYKEIMDSGGARECARMILPMAASTTLYLKGSVRSWIHYLNVRCDEHTQKEHRLIANEIREIFKKWFPITSEALALNTQPQ